jgi:pyrimidine-specific ribonucleoside hydrolase
MKYAIIFSGLLLLAFQIHTEKKTPVPVIFDTDIHSDYDDVGAITLLHAFADSGEATILATVSSNKHKLVAPVIDVFNTYFGRPELPIGAPKEDGFSMDCSQRWSDSITMKYPHRIKCTDDVEDAVKVYRKALANAKDRSVTIVTVGFLTNLKNLLRSTPDSYSNLNGIDLVKKKVNKLVAMAGAFPTGREYNLYCDSIASIYTFKNWPTKIIFTGFEIGEKIRTGKRVIAEPGSNPVKDVFRISMPYWPGDTAGRCSWDETAVLIAIKGTSPYFNAVKGKIIVNKDGSNTWNNSATGLHEYVTFRMPIPELTNVIETLMLHKPMKK